MLGTTKKLLTILLSLVLMLAPLQGAYAAFAVESAHDEHMLQIQDDQNAATVTILDQLAQYCDHCEVTGDCTNHHCSSSHHVSSLFLPVLLYTLQHPSLSGMSSIDDGTVRHIPASFFRPPRA